MLTRGARRREAVRGRRSIVDVHRQPHRSGDASPDLDLVERLGLSRIEQLERGSAGVEDRPAPVRSLPGLDLGEAQGVAIERDGAVVVVDRQGDAKLMDGGHARTLASDRLAA